MIIAVIVLGVVCAVLAALVLRKPGAPAADPNAALLLKQHGILATGELAA